MKTHSLILRYPQAPFLEIRISEKSNRIYESHAHPTLSIGVMKEGKTVFQTPKGLFLLNQGALAIIEPHLQHACNPHENTLRSYIMVYLDRTYCERIQQKCFKEALSFLPLHSPLIFHQGLHEEFMRIINALIDGYDALHVKALEAWLERFFWLYTAQGEVHVLDETPAAIASFLENRLDECIRLNELAKRFSMNPFVLVRKFKASYGCTPKHYWLDMRIHHAKKLLAQGIPLSLCAQYCGFADQSHFHRFFKRRTALTPKEYQVNFVQ